MSRKQPSPQDRATQLNLSVPRYIADAIDEACTQQGYKNRSKWCLEVFKKKLGLE